MGAASWQQGDQEGELNSYIILIQFSELRIGDLEYDSLKQYQISPNTPEASSKKIL
jgi:hypothetical protein